MKCSQQTCAVDASWSYVWPGRAERMFACDLCLVRAELILGAIGCEVSDLLIVEGFASPARVAGLEAWRRSVGATGNG